MACEPSSNSWFRCRRIVEFRDTDAAGIAHFSAFFFWMESTEHEFLRELGVRVVDNDPEDRERLLREFRKHVSSYRKPIDDIAPAAPLSKEMMNILSEGR